VPSIAPAHCNRILDASSLLHLPLTLRHILQLVCYHIIILEQSQLGCPDMLFILIISPDGLCVSFLQTCLLWIMNRRRLSAVSTNHFQKHLCYAQHTNLVLVLGVSVMSYDYWVVLCFIPRPYFGGRILNVGSLIYLFLTLLHVLHSILSMYVVSWLWYFSSSLGLVLSFPQWSHCLFSFVHFCSQKSWVQIR